MFLSSILISAECSIELSLSAVEIKHKYSDTESQHRYTPKLNLSWFVQHGNT